MNRGVVIAVGAASLGALLLGGLAVRLLHLTDLRRVHPIVDSLPLCDREIADHRRALLERVAGAEVARVATAGVLAEIDRDGARGGEDLHERVWSFLLPRLLSRRDLAALYAHYLPLKAGRSLCFGAMVYFSRPADQLTDQELTELVVISSRPVEYSTAEGRLLARERAGALLRGLPGPEATGEAPRSPAPPDHTPR